MSDSTKQAAPALGEEGLETTLLRPPGPPQPEHGEAPTWPSAPREPLPAELAPGRTLAGRYTVLDFLGQGGMGLVLAAYDPRLDRRVALKLLRSRKRGSSSGGQEQARLSREAQSLARLSHPNVVAVYDSGPLEDGSLFIAMEYVEGQTLRQWCTAPPRTWRQVLSTYLEAGRGLAAAHAAGLIHRDFKPDNVLVGKDGRARVMDFGLARVRPVMALAGGTAPPSPSPLPMPGMPEPSLGLAEFHLTLGKPSEALPLLERALPLASVEDRADVQFALARALAETRRELPRARSLAAQAQESWQGLGHPQNLSRVTRWLASLPAP